MTNQHPESDTSKQPPLGIAGKMAQAFIHSPLSPLLFIAMLLMGVLGLILTPRQEDPQISVPMVDIFIQYPGATSQQVASLAIEPLQRIMSEIPGIKHVYSASERNQGMVTVEFEVGEQLENSVFKVHDKLQSNLDKIPPGVSMPLVKPKGIDDVPVVALTLWSEDKGVDESTLRTVALDVMQSLKEINNTGQSFVVGGQAEQVRIQVIPERLSSYGLSLGQIARTVQTANSESNAGYVESEGQHFTIYTGSFLRDSQEVEQLVVGTYHDSPIYIRDVATVTQGPEEPQQIVSYYSGPAYGYELQKHEPSITIPTKRVEAAPAVTIAVSKKIGTNGVTVANAVLKHVDLLRNRFIIPDNIEIEVTRNYGKTANDKVNDLIKKLFIATGAVTLLVWYALGWRPALVVTLVIPVVILITVFSAWISGYTIDRVSLFALIFSIGILVDDAIVVIENIYRRWLIKGETDTETAVDAVREVGNPTILATFTVVAALLPMGFVSGMMGPYMEPIPALGSVAMVFSLIAAFIFTPWLAMRFKPSLSALHKAEQKEHRSSENLEKFFRKILPPLFNSKLKGGLFLFALIFLLLLACYLFYIKVVEVKMLPLDNKPEFNVFIDMPEGTALFETNALTQQLARELLKIPEVTALQTYVGTSQPFDFNGMVRHYYLRQKAWQADIHVQLKEKTDRKRSSHQIATEARRNLQELVAKLNNTKVNLTVVEMPPGPPVLQSVVAEIYGPDEFTRRQVAKKFTEAFEKAEIVDDVDNYMVEMDDNFNPRHEAWKFEVNAEKAVRRGISVDMINQNLLMAMGNFKLGDIKLANANLGNITQGKRLEPIYIIIQVPLEERSQLNSLYDLPIPTQTGETIPLAELGRFVKVKQDHILYQKDLRPVEYVVGDSVGIYEGNNEYRQSAPIYGILEVEKLLKDYKTPDNVNIIEDGCFHLLGIVPLCKRFLGPPEADGRSGFEWSGEWTVTYETFRDMGAAFMVALVLIYILVVWLFGNFIVPMVIMVPIPLTLLGIIPAHRLLDAEFTATSMIGWIALAGIIVRNSILLVDYSVHEIQQKGAHISDAVILACKTRTRPIMITAFALVLGSMVILWDPIFQGMAISLLSGVLVSTLLTLVVIPLGCISIGPKLLCSTGMGEAKISVSDEVAEVKHTYSMPLWMRAWSFIIGIIFWLINAVTMVFYLIRGIFLLLWSGLLSLWHRLVASARKPSPPNTSPPSTGSGPPAPPPVPSSPPPPPPAPVVEDKTPTASSATSIESSSPAVIPKVEPVETPQLTAKEPQVGEVQRLDTPPSLPVISASTENQNVDESGKYFLDQDIIQNEEEDSALSTADALNDSQSSEPMTENERLTKKMKRNMSKKPPARRGIRLKPNLPNTLDKEDTSQDNSNLDSDNQEKK